MQCRDRNSRRRGFGWLWLLVLSSELVVWTPRGYSQNSLPVLNENYDNHEHAKPAQVSVRALSIPTKARKPFKKGVDRLNAQDASGSLHYFNEAIEKFPGFYEAYYDLGVAQLRLNETEKAGKSFQAAIDLSSGKFPLAEFAYSLLLCSQGKMSDAESLARHGLEQDQTMPDGFIALGVIMLWAGRPEDAQQCASEALLRNRWLANAYLISADAHFLLNQYGAASDDLKTYFKLSAKSGAPTTFALDLLSRIQYLTSESESHAK